MADSPSHPWPLSAGAEPAARLFGLGFSTAGTEAGAAEEAAGGECAGAVIGRYELKELLGEGGYGHVWRARQHEPIQREVALKVIKPGLDSREVIARFEAERQALALMDHPSIAAVLDAGTTAGGRPFFVMELVQGAPITEYCDQRAMSLRERVELFIPVCQAVQHAHQKAVLHRDLKPSNILVTEIDGRPVPKVIDFGIAKALGPGAETLSAGRYGETAAGMVVGTPQYMSPEQAGSRADVDTRSDVYSLGVVLCELLTGQAQLPAEPADFAAVLRWVRETEPVRPSVLAGQRAGVGMAEAAGRRGVEPARFVRLLKGDLDWITLKALEKDRTRRYETATALARDLQRYLEQKTVSAAAPTWHYQLGKFAVRHRAALVAACLAVAALITGTVVSLWQAANAEHSRAEAERQFDRAREAVDQYLSNVTEHPRLRQTDFLDLRKSLLESALPFYEEMSRAQGQDVKVRESRAHAYGRLASMHLSLGDYAKADVAYAKSIEIENLLAADFPEDMYYPFSLAHRHHNVAIMHRQQGRFEEALKWGRQARELAEKVCRRRPGVRDYQQLLALTTYGEGVTLDTMKNLAEAERVFLKALAIEEELLSRHPDHLPSRLQFSSCHLALGMVYSKSPKSYPQAKTFLRRAAELHQQDSERTQGWRESRSQLASSLLTLAQVCAYEKHHAEGAPHLARSVDVFQRLVSEHPTVPNYREGLIIGLQTVSEYASARGDSAAEEAALARMSLEQERLMAEFPSSHRQNTPYARAVYKLAGRERDRQQWGRARDLYERALRADPVHEYASALMQAAVQAGDYETVLRHGGKWMEILPPDGLSRSSALAVLVRAEELIGKNPELEAGAKGEKTMTIKQWQKAVTDGWKKTEAAGAAKKPAAAPARAAAVESHAGPGPGTQAGPETVARSPQSFRFYFNAGDPGFRLWRREGLKWTETQPNGTENSFEVERGALIGNVRGTVIRRLGKTKMHLFVPDLGGTQTPALLMRMDDGKWHFLGDIADPR